MELEGPAQVHQRHAADLVGAIDKDRLLKLAIIVMVVVVRLRVRRVQPPIVAAASTWFGTPDLNQIGAACDLNGGGIGQALLLASGCRTLGPILRSVAVNLWPGHETLGANAGHPADYPRRRGPPDG